MRLRLVVFAVLAATLVAGHLVRQHLGVTELSAAGLQAAVADLGWRAPFVFFVLVVFRQFLALPAWVLLPAGGACFGAALGTALGGSGIIVSGTLKFWIARWLGREWFRARMGERFQRFDAHIDRLGALVIGLSTAHPMGVLSPFHWGAGLSSLRFAPFAAALVLGAPVRAFAFSVVGASLVAGHGTTLWLASGAVALALAVPLAFPQVRRRFFPG